MTSAPVRPLTKSRPRGRGALAGLVLVALGSSACASSDSFSLTASPDTEALSQDSQTGEPSQALSGEILPGVSTFDLGDLPIGTDGGAVDPTTDAAATADDAGETSPSGDSSDGSSQDDSSAASEPDGTGDVSVPNVPGISDSVITGGGAYDLGQIDGYEPVFVRAEGDDVAQIGAFLPMAAQFGGGKIIRVSGRQIAVMEEGGTSVMWVEGNALIIGSEAPQSVLLEGAKRIIAGGVPLRT